MDAGTRQASCTVACVDVQSLASNAENAVWCVRSGIWTMKQIWIQTHTKTNHCQERYFISKRLTSLKRSCVSVGTANNANTRLPVWLKRIELNGAHELPVTMSVHALPRQRRGIAQWQEGGTILITSPKLLAHENIHGTHTRLADTVALVLAFIQVQGWWMSSYKAASRHLHIWIDSRCLLVFCTPIEPSLSQEEEVERERERELKTNCNHVVMTAPRTRQTVNHSLLYAGHTPFFSRSHLRKKHFSV